MSCAPLSGAHLNPAVTIGVAIKSGDWSQTPIYLAAQILGAMTGAYVKRTAVPGTVTQAIELGRIVRQANRGAQLNEHNSLTLAQ